MSIAKNATNLSSFVREVVFGVEDGMVSTLGAVSGIAVGSQDKYTILLAGIVIVAVESISMGIGSYVSNRSVKEVEEKELTEEKEKHKNLPGEEKKAVYQMFIRDGWVKSLALKMARYAGLNKKLMLKEHQYRELGIFPYQKTRPLRNALLMFVSYIVGGLFPLVSYFLLPISVAIYSSVLATLTGLFLLGVITTFYTKVKPIRAGLRLMVMGSIAFGVGFLVGKVARTI
jgi:predicted membrane protein (TIGR00267 family)